LSTQPPVLRTPQGSSPAVDYKIYILSEKQQQQRLQQRKPHDAETRIALTLFHQWKREAITGNSRKSSITTENSSSKTVGGTTAGARSSAKTNPSPSIVTVTSDLGLSREVSSPRQLADLIGPLLEEDFRNNPQWNMAPDVRSQASGIVSMISMERSQMLRLAGRLPCPRCIQWCKGEKGLWWHQQQYHKVEYADATTVAQATGINAGAIVLYGEPYSNVRISIANGGDNTNGTKPGRLRADHDNDPMEDIREGNLDGLKRAVQNHGYQPSKAFDAKGATPLMWAAGGGCLEMTVYLVEECGCSPNQSQRGKRSFAGRTALHWAARNGRLGVVRYLLALATSDSVASQRVRGTHSLSIGDLLEAKTRDGTTAFGWACWQRHLAIMECLFRHGCNIHARNSYGCSPVLWCSQGTNQNGLEALKWLRDKGCNIRLVNHNGHGVLHKAAQRGQRDIAEWLVREECGGLVTDQGSTTTTTTMPVDDASSTSSTAERTMFMALIGPDIEGYCPSDLAGMEGHGTFAEWLARVEIAVCRNLDCTPAYALPEGYSSHGGAVTNDEGSSSSSYVWEQYGGLRRIRSSLQQSRDGKQLWNDPFSTAGSFLD